MRKRSYVRIALGYWLLFQSIALAELQRPDWLDSPLPWLRETETWFYSEPSPTPQQVSQRLLRYGQAWGVEQIEKRLPDLIATEAESRLVDAWSEKQSEARHGVSQVPDSQLPWLWQILALISGNLRPSQKAQNDPATFARTRAILPMPQEWISNKFLILAFLYRVAPVGLIEGTVVADRIPMNPEFFANHDLSHARYTWSIVYDSIGLTDHGKQLYGKYRARLLLLRDAFAEDIWALPDGCEELDKAFDLVHETIQRLPNMVDQTQVRLGNVFSTLYPRTAALIASWREPLSDYFGSELERLKIMLLLKFPRFNVQFHKTVHLRFTDLEFGFDTSANNVRKHLGLELDQLKLAEKAAHDGLAELGEILLWDLDQLQSADDIFLRKLKQLSRRNTIPLHEIASSFTSEELATYLPRFWAAVKNIEAKVSECINFPTITVSASGTYFQKDVTWSEVFPNLARPNVDSGESQEIIREMVINGLADRKTYPSHVADHLLKIYGGPNLARSEKKRASAVQALLFKSQGPVRTSAQQRKLPKVPPACAAMVLKYARKAGS